jgi:signal transduction histidine kinase
MKARGFPLGEVITNFILVTYIPSFLLIHIFVKNSSNYKFGAATLFSSLTLLVLSVPYIQPIGMGSPFFQHLPVLLVLCYVLLDIKVTIYLSGIIIVYLVLQYTGLEQYLGIKIAGELDPITTDRYRTRFTSTIITLAIIFVLHKISYAIRSALAEEKIKAASVERYETLGKVAAGFAHEINNPLAIASGHANQLREFKEVKKFQDKIDKIEVAHQRISSIVSNFLAIFSIKDTLIRPTVLNLCFSRLNHEILSKIKISVPKDATVNSNFEHLVQVLKFITENALEAAKGSNPPVEWVIFDDYSIACIDYDVNRCMPNSFI